MPNQIAIILNMPIWTDVVQAFAAIIAVPGAIAAFVLLFKKDKDKQTQLDRLTDISESMKAQNETSKESNRILSDQVDVLRTLNIGTGLSEDEARKMRKLEEKKLKLEHRPFFRQPGMSTGASDGFHMLRLLNAGKRAQILRYECASDGIDVNPPKENYIVEEGSKIEIRVNYGDNRFRHRAFEIDIHYEDAIGTEYFQKVKRENHSITILPPAENEINEG